MKVNSADYSVPFQSKCPEVKLGQDICRAVNNEFPHISLTKLKPTFEKGYAYKKITPVKTMKMIIDFNNIRPSFLPRSFNYLNDVIEFSKKYKSYNCTESAFLSLMALVLNGYENGCVAEVLKGGKSVDHVVCVFNRNGSRFDGDVYNNQTIIIDAWAGICDFANNLFVQYDKGELSKHFKNYKGEKFSLKSMKTINLSEREKEYLTKEHLSLIV